MNFLSGNISLLKKEQVNGNNCINFFRVYGKKAAATDFAVLLGAIVGHRSYGYSDLNYGRTAAWSLIDDYYGDTYIININGYIASNHANKRINGIRPIIPLDIVPKNLLKNKKNTNGYYEVEFGEYPQSACKGNLSKELEDLYPNKLKRTGKKYTVDGCGIYEYDRAFQPTEIVEFEYNNERYVRVNSDDINGKLFFSNSEIINPSNSYWIKVEPIKWIIDEASNLLICKDLIASGIRFCDEKKYSGNFEDTEIYKYLNHYFARDIFNREMITEYNNSVSDYINPIENNNIDSDFNNPYGLDFEEIKEEDIINGAIEADIPVFLHGKSSDGKSARVKAIDPDLTIIYLRNATPDSLNGKSVYNEKTGEMIDIKPTWLKKLEDKCNNEPNKNHILFFDEITNAFPSIQGIAFNIILDKEVNGTWKLPKNARIVAAGNELSDSLAANELAEPLFNRFAHVYINTTTESWLKWASDNNIHPAIYSYIAYRNGETLRTKYNGETPNADPRKWEMASNMLYKTGNPVMLRALVGEDVCRDFIKFCKIRVITIDDVINNRYDINFITNMDSSEKYATVLGLSQVKEDNFKIVRDFIKLLGSEFLTTFDNIWARNDINRLEMIASERLTKSMK